MKRTRARSGSVVVIAVLSLVIAAASSAQDLPEMSDDAKAAMNAWMELRTPGEHHQHLAQYAGSWKMEVTMWMEPGAEPMTDAGAAEARLILGERYLEWTFTGVFGGMPFEARQLDAYNNGDQRYETVWADNFGTLFVNYAGECDGDGKVRTMHGEFTDPMSGGTISNRTVHTWQDEDHWTHESYMTMGEEEYKNMEIRYSRAE